jgi:sulfatase maturation enzyme AslB (radical SAM superfamily)
MEPKTDQSTFHYKETEFTFDIDKLRFSARRKDQSMPVNCSLQGADETSMPHDPAKPGINFVTLNIAHDCNMACPYCFAKQGLYGGPRRMMKPETAHRAVDWLIQQSGTKKDCYLRFLGGEPFMNLDVMESTIQYALAKGAMHGKNIHFSVNTNGTLFSEKIAHLLNSYSIIVSVSMDGTEEAHNVHRIFRSGLGTYQVVARNLERFVQCDPRVMINCTITADNVDVYSYAKLFRELGISLMRFAIVGDPNHKIAVRAADLLQRIRMQYDMLADAYLEDLLRGDVWYVADFYKYFENLRSLSRRTHRCGAGTTYVNIDVEGVVHLCHRFTADSNQTIGTISSQNIIPPAGIVQMNQLLPMMPKVSSQSKQESQPAPTSADDLPAIHKRLDGSPMIHKQHGPAPNLCSICDIKYLCGGSCFHDGQMLYGDLHGGPDPFKCEVDRHLARISMWLLDQLSGRPEVLTRLDELHYQSIQHTK